MRRYLPVAGLAAVVTTLAALGVLPRWGGLVYLVALPPLDLFADLRLLVGMAPSYPVFVAGVGALLAVRIAILALLLGGLRRHAGLAAAVYGAALVPALLAALLQFSGQAGLYARIFWPGALLAGAGLLLLGPVAWQGTERLRAGIGDSWRTGLRVDVAVPYAGAVLALGTAAGVWGGPVAVAAVPISAALTVLAIHRLRAPAPAHPVVALLGVAAVGVAVGAAFELSRTDEPRMAPAQPSGSLVLMSGINSASGEGTIFEVDPAVYGYPCERTFHYSYAGPGEGAPQGDSACPITTGAPYTEPDTQRPLAELVEAFRLQVADLPGPVTVVAHSQAPWIAWAALAAHGTLGVERLVLLGAFPDNPLGYPPPGEPGPGRVGGEGLRLVAATGRALGFAFEPDAPLGRELLATADASSTVFSQPLPAGVAVLEIPAVVDLPLKPHGPGVAGREAACPVRAAHPYLPASGEVHAALTRFLTGDPQPHCPAWRGLLGTAGRSLAVPPLHTG